MWPFLEKCLQEIIEEKLNALKDLYIVYDLDNIEATSIRQTVPALPPHVDYMVYFGQDPTIQAISCIVLQIRLNKAGNISPPINYGESVSVTHLLKDSSGMSSASPHVSTSKDQYLTCKMDIDEHDENTTYSVDTDENGGFYRMPNIKSQLYIPDGALADKTRMQIIGHGEHTLGKNTDMDKARAISNIYELLPHGQSFMKYVTFRFPLRLRHRFDVGGLKILYSATGKNEESDWQEIPLTTSRGAHSSGLSWLVWERHCHVMMQHFCKIRVIMTDTGEETSALYVNASLTGQYFEQLQLVKLDVVFSCGEQDSSDQILNSGLKVISQEVILLYKNCGDIEMNLTLHDNQEWQVDEDEQTQFLDKNILFLKPPCQLKTLPKKSFTINQKQSTLLKGKISIKQKKREYPVMFRCHLDVKELRNDTDEIIAKLKNEKEQLQEEKQEMQKEKEDLQRKSDQLREEKQSEQEQKEKLMSLNEEMQKEKDNLLRKSNKLQEEKQIKQNQKEKLQEEIQRKTKGKSKMLKGPNGAKPRKKVLLPVPVATENNPCGGFRNDVASTSQSSYGNGASANCNSLFHAPQQVSQWFSHHAGNKGTNNIIINQTITNTYNEPGRHENGLLALEDKTWPTGFDREFYTYLFEFRVELNKNKTKLHKMADSLGILHTNGFNAEELVKTWYVTSMAKSNNSDGESDAQALWVDLRNILIKEEHIKAAAFLTFAIEKQRIRDNMMDFVHNLQMDDILDKLYSKRVINGKQKKDFQKEKLSLSELITEVILKADLQRFNAFKESLEETDQKVLLEMIKLAEEQ